MIRHATILIYLASMSCIAACTPGATTVTLGAEITLAPGVTISVAGAEMTVRFDGVTEDSRCPVGSTCIWAGEVKVQLAIRVSQVDSMMTLRESESAVAAGYRVTLLRVEPQPTGNARIVESDYRATLKIDEVR
jgi:hypothetical protein